MQPTLQLADNGYYMSDNSYLSANQNFYLSQQGNNYGSMLSADADDIYIKVPTAAGIIKVREDAFDQLDPITYNAVMDYLEPFNAPPVMNGLFSGWRARRQQRRDDRQANKIAKIQARGESRAKVAASGGGVAGVISKIGNLAGNILGGGTSGATAPGDSRAFEVSGGLDFGQEATPIYKQWWFWGLLAAAGLGVAYMAKKR